MAATCRTLMLRSIARQSLAGRSWNMPASKGDDTRVPRSIEITDAAGEELLYVVFWAGPKASADVGDEPVDVPTVH